MSHFRINRGLVAATLSAATVALLAAGSATGSATNSPAPEPPIAVEAAPAEAEDGGVVAWDPAMPTWVRAREQRRLCHMAETMPSTWPAAIAIRQQAEQPLGDAQQRDRWRRDAERLPSGWPAAQAMLAAADERLDCSWWIGA